jgi:hypothetical protein
MSGHKQICRKGWAEISSGMYIQLVYREQKIITACSVIKTYNTLKTELTRISKYEGKTL